MAQVSFRIDDTLKEEADIVFHDMGMNMSTAITIFIRQTINRQAIPFEVRSSRNALSDSSRILASAQDYENGRKGYRFHELPNMAIRASASPNRSRGILRGGGECESTKRTDSSFA